jgi:hypothetical protein
MKISNFKLGIGIPHNFPMVPDEFFDSFIVMEKPDFSYLRSARSNIENMRNEIAREALRSGCTHVLMLDSDQAYEVETVMKLLSYKLPVVGCLVYRRYPPFDPLVFRNKNGIFESIIEWEPGSLIEVDRTGTGCILYDTEIFRAIPYPWFRFRSGPYGATIGEDFGFCDDLRQKGYKIYVDTSIPSDHLTHMLVNDATWKLYKRMKEAELKALQKDLNSKPIEGG